MEKNVIILPLRNYVIKLNFRLLEQFFVHLEVVVAVTASESLPRSITYHFCKLMEPRTTPFLPLTYL